MNILLNEIKFERITKEDFGVNSLDCYNRYQETTECLRLIGDEYVYINDSFIENWNADKLREKENEILEFLEISNDFIGFIAKHDDKIVGFAYFGIDIIGSEMQYIELKMFHTSYEYRGMGIGKKLFNLLCEEARKTPVKKIYISSHPARQTQDVYKKLGCVYATEIIEEILAHEPLDIQLEYVL